MARTEGTLVRRRRIRSRRVCRRPCRRSLVPAVVSVNRRAARPAMLTIDLARIPRTRGQHRDAGRLRCPGDTRCPAAPVQCRGPERRSCRDPRRFRAQRRTVSFTVTRSRARIVGISLQIGRASRAIFGRRLPHPSVLLRGIVAQAQVHDEDHRGERSCRRDRARSLSGCRSGFQYCAVHGHPSSWFPAPTPTPTGSDARSGQRR